MKTAAGRSSREVKNYLIAGTLNTVLSYGIYAGAIYLGFGYKNANLISLLIGIVTSYALQSRFVFKSRSYYIFFKYILCWTGLYFLIINVNGYFLAHGANAYLSGALTLPAGVLFSYLIQKFLVFKRHVN